MMKIIITLVYTGINTDAAAANTITTTTSKTATIITTFVTTIATVATNMVHPRTEPDQKQSWA